MEITDVEVLTYHFPIDEAWDDFPSWHRIWHNSGTGWENTVEARQEAIVKVHTDEGITGLGSADTGHKDARIVKSVVNNVLAPIVVGEDPTNIEQLWQKMWRACGPHLAGDKGIGVGALGGIDVACWDILGKSLGAPIYDLLGGEQDAPVKPYIGTFTHGWRKLDDIESIVEEAKFYVEDGYEAIKVRGGRGPPNNGDLKTIEALRREFPPEKLVIMVDVNGGYSRQNALDMAEIFDEYDIFWMEDPFESKDVVDYAKFQEKVNINIFTGSGPTSMKLSSMLKAGVTTNFVSLSTEHGGGITEAKKVATLIDSWDLKTAAIAHEPLGSLATFHVWKSVPPKITEDSYVEYDPENSCWNELLTDPPEFKNGRLVLSDKPGLGTDINETFIEEHPLPDEPMQNII